MQNGPIALIEPRKNLKSNSRKKLKGERYKMKVLSWFKIAVLSLTSCYMLQAVAEQNTEQNLDSKTEQVADQNATEIESKAYSEQCPKCPECVIYASDVAAAEFNNKYLGQDMRYINAVKDALTIEEEELLPLVSLDKNSQFVTYDDQDRVLLLSLHAYPDSYIEGTDMKLPYQCWSFTDKEFKAWYGRNSNGVTNWTLRLNQLLGMPAERKSTHITAIWVHPEDVLRPAYRTDVFNQEPSGSFEESKEEFAGIQVHSYIQAKSLEKAKELEKALSQASNNKANAELADPQITERKKALLKAAISSDQELSHENVQGTYHTHSLDSFKSWFNKNIIASYFSQHDYPWTRIGYTYDWAHALRADGNNGASEYGVTEFLVPQHTKVTVAYTLSIKDFIKKIAKEVEQDHTNSTTNYFLQ